MDFQGAVLCVCRGRRHTRLQGSSSMGVRDHDISGSQLWHDSSCLHGLGMKTFCEKSRAGWEQQPALELEGFFGLLACSSVQQ